MSHLAPRWMDGCVHQVVVVRFGLLLLLRSHSDTEQQRMKTTRFGSLEKGIHVVLGALSKQASERAGRPSIAVTRWLKR